MTTTQIISKIIAMHKDASFDDVAELLAAKAMVSDLPMIEAELSAHRSSNEMNAADHAIAWISTAA